MVSSATFRPYSEVPKGRYHTDASVTGNTPKINTTAVSDTVPKEGFMNWAKKPIKEVSWIDKMLSGAETFMDTKAKNAAEKLTETEGKGFLSKAVKFFGEKGAKIISKMKMLPVGLAAGTVALEAIGQAGEVIQGVKEGRWIRQPLKSATVVAGSTTGFLAGMAATAGASAAAAAAVGTAICPVAGTIVGAAVGLIGGVIGGWLGSAAANGVGSAIFGSNKGYTEEEAQAADREVATQEQEQAPQGRFGSMTARRGGGSSAVNLNDPLAGLPPL